MNEKMWFTKRPGQLAETPADGGVAFLHGDPDVVRLPANLGGEVCKVVGRSTMKCPKCVEHLCPVLHLDIGINVLECPDCGFIWYKV